MAGEWATKKAIANLRDWWPDLSISTGEIGRRLHVSKNAIVGKAHRLRLDPRPSPIIREPKLPSAPPVAPRATLPPLASAARPEWSPPPLHPLPPPRPVIAAPPPKVARMVERPAGRVAPCCWVTRMGDGRGRLATYCDEPGVPGKPYCGEHFKLAHVKVRDRRADQPAHGAAMGGD